MTPSDKTTIPWGNPTFIPPLKLIDHQSIIEGIDDILEPEQKLLNLKIDHVGRISGYNFHFTDDLTARITHAWLNIMTDDQRMIFALTYSHFYADVLQMVESE